MSSGKTVYQWIVEYRMKHGHMPKKPIYLDYRALPSIRKELVMTFDEFERAWTEDYDAEKHGEVKEETFHTFTPFIH